MRSGFPISLAIETPTQCVGRPDSGVDGVDLLACARAAPRLSFDNLATRSAGGGVDSLGKEAEKTGLHGA